jgi:hypothetical protein
MSKNEKGKEEPQKATFSTMSYHNALIFSLNLKNNVSMIFYVQIVGVFFVDTI